MASLVKGSILTLKSMGFWLLFREVLRRIFKVKYHYRGVLVDSSITFRLLREAALRGYDIYSSNGEIVFRTHFGEFGVDTADVGLLAVLFEPLEEMYGFVNVKGAVVVDIGAYIGDTALFFLSKGASRIYALEPVDRHYQYLLKNILRNNAVKHIIPLNYGAWLRNTTLRVDYEGTGTGLRESGDAKVIIRAKNLGNILRKVFESEGRINLVKMDCEGCEYSLLSLSGEDIRLAEQYIIEVHGSPYSIIDKMSESGYKPKLMRRMPDLIAVYHFTRG